LLLTI